MTASVSMQVRDGIMTRLKVMPFFASFAKFSTSRALQIQSQQLPFCAVYFLQENSFPEGDADAGEVRFRTTTRYGFSVIVLNNDAEAAEVTLDNAYVAMTTALFADETLYNNPLAKIQSFNAANRSHVFGNMGQDNETPIAELRFELVCDLGTITYPPGPFPDLKIIHVKTQYPGGDTQQDIDSRQQVESEYDLITE